MQNTNHTAIAAREGAKSGSQRTDGAGKEVLCTTVVLELLLLDNLLMDYLVLWLAAALLRRRLRLWRALCGAGVGSIYALLALWPPLAGWLGFGVCKLVCAICMALAAFGWRQWRALAVDAGATLLAAVLLGGAGLAAFFLLGDGKMHMAGGVVYMGVGMRFCAMGALGGVGLWRWMRRLLERSARADAFGYRMEIWLRGRRVQVRALLDSGNALAEPISGDPVAVVRRQALGELLPLGWPLCEDAGKVVGCRMVPYRGVDGIPRLLPAFRADKLVLGQKGKLPMTVERAYVATLEHDGWEGCDALIGAMLPADAGFASPGQGAPVFHARPSRRPGAGDAEQPAIEQRASKKE